MNLFPCKPSSKNLSIYCCSRELYPGVLHQEEWEIILLLWKKFWPGKHLCIWNSLSTFLNASLAKDIYWRKEFLIWSFEKSTNDSRLFLAIQMILLWCVSCSEAFSCYRFYSWDYYWGTNGLWCSVHSSVLLADTKSCGVPFIVVSFWQTQSHVVFHSYQCPFGRHGNLKLH